MRTYLVVDGVKGESFTMKSIDGAIDVVGFENEMGYPFDRAIGEKTGQLVYHPIHVTKRVDSATPLIFQHLSNNTAIGEIQLLFYRETDEGSSKWEHYFTITLTDVRVVSQKTTMALQDDKTEKASFLERVSFIGRTVDFTHPLASVAHSIDVRDSVG